MSNTKHTPGICYNCGADDGLHHHLTNQCPKNGREETREGKKQEWAETTFENKKWRQVRDAAPELLKNLVRLLDRINENDLWNTFPSACERAEAAIKKATE